MRGKVAKALRRHAKNVAAKEGWIATAPERINTHVKTYPQLAKFQLDGNGVKHVTDTGMRGVFQHWWPAHSMRGFYLHTKAGYKKAKRQ